MSSAFAPPAPAHVLGACALKWYGMCLLWTRRFLFDGARLATDSNAEQVNRNASLALQRRSLGLFELAFQAVARNCCPMLPADGPGGWRYYRSSDSTGWRLDSLALTLCITAAMRPASLCRLCTGTDGMVVQLLDHQTGKVQLVRTQAVVPRTLRYHANG